MNSKKLLLTGFILMALVQLAIPGKMIWDRERILESGKEFRFSTAPIDPTDPFRGKYIILNYMENSIEIEDENDWYAGEIVFATIESDLDGFAKIKSVSKEKPSETSDFLKLKVDYISGNRIKTLNFSYPFDRFYMEESKAYEAEQIHIKNQSDTSKTTYALVRIKNGNAVLEDVMIDGVPIREVVKENRKSI